MLIRLFLSVVLVLCSPCLASEDVVHARALVRRAKTLTAPDEPQQSGTISTCNKWYDVVSGDTCSSVVAAFGITLAQFLQWNPAVSSDCTQNFWVGDSYCVGVGAAKTTSTTKGTSSTTKSISTVKSSVTSSSTVKSTSTSKSTSTTKTSTSQSSISIPPNTEPYSVLSNATFSVAQYRPTATAGAMQTGIASPCIRLYQANPGDTCESIVSTYTYLSLEQFIEWNPAVGSDCVQLWVNYFYCIDAPINTASLPNATTQFPVPPLTVFLPSPTSVNATFVPSPTAPGAVAGCQSWYIALQNDTCASIVTTMGYLSLSDFESWNTGVNCNNLTAGDYYCVADYDASNLPLPSTVTTKPSPVQTGITASCTAWYLATFGDDCTTIPQSFGTFSESDFLSWNPALGGTGCAGLIPGDYYCVAVPGTPKTRTSSHVSTTSLSTNGVGPQPEQTGIPASCTTYWLVSPSDNCTTIAAANGVTETQIESWNPALGGQGCPHLLANYYICVGMDSKSISTTVTSGPTTGSTGTTKTTSTTQRSSTISTTRSSTVSTTRSSTASTTTAVHVSTPTPVQVGMTVGCVRFYFVEPGDGCFAIATDAGIALNDFYSWNPAVKTDCSGLQADVYVCIGLAGPPLTITSGAPFGPTPSPVQTGMASGCTRFYLVESGDNCSMIATDAGIQLSAFYAMNPAVGSSCGTLEAGVYVCLATSGSPTTITKGTPVHAPTTKV